MKQLFADFVVIVLGVLVALALDGYASGRRDRAAERQYAARLAADLAADTTRFARFRVILDVKARTLGELLDDPNAFSAIDDPVGKMSALKQSTFIGLPPIDSSTFEELQHTGSLRLLKDASLRSELTGHYTHYERITGILDLSFSPFRDIVLSSLPGRLQYAARKDSLAVDEESLRVGLETLIRHGELKSTANAELAYTAALRFYLDEADARTRDLLAVIDSMY